MFQEDRHERVTGPLSGYWLAAYAVATDAGFVGYAKLCVHEPRDVWQARAFIKMAAPMAPTAEAALILVEQCAADVIRWMAPSDFRLHSKWPPASSRHGATAGSGVSQLCRFLSRCLSTAISRARRR